MTDQAAALRRAFDETFSLPPRQEAKGGLDVLLARIGSQVYGVRRTDISGLVVDRKVVAVPSRCPEFLGLAGLKGALVPVYDLAALLGQKSTERPRWLLLTAPPDRVALAFEQLVGTQRSGALSCPILEIAAVVENVKRLASRAPEGV